ncbi:8-amino-7-oxononanoate synthase [Hydrogenophaga pseudoflava]|uniref:8-amino-7-oxononanoate synthase n=1 Tax=Hydrogenophaga pseudoflava TaxID=47421 RepID=UPI0027E508BB|nr:8-amino-7-oxononanoate synthase [Hydrogenophaga pseudoflava]MDQ7744718.1 8-amino-7-oxononanoate synthase [Hydrogenophaga pseudoflava]
MTNRPPTDSWLDEIPARIGALDAAHLRRRRRAVEPAGGALLRVDGRDMLAFCSNDYLGLASHPEMAEAACEGARRFGVGAGASPLVSGHSTANEALEEELAAFVGLPRALYFYAGYATNIGIVPALVGDGDAIFSDALNHACLIDGARLSRARIHRFTHADLADLAQQLAASPARRKLVISDAVFSMDGDVADIPALLALCERHDALLLLDDAHGFGVCGPQGRGSLAAVGLNGACASRRVLYMATLGKAAGVAGAFVAGPDDLVEWLLQKTRSYIFATAAPALLACALRSSLRLIEQCDGRRAQLQRLIARLRQGLQPVLARSGWRLGHSDTPIQPLLIGGNAEALAVMEGLRGQGIWVPAIRPPTVPEGTARLRIALSAAHTEAHIDRLVQALDRLAPDTAQPPGA